MSRFSLFSLAYAAVVILATYAICQRNSPTYREESDWRHAIKLDNALAYRLYYENWRQGVHSRVALDRWRVALTNDLNKLDFLSPDAVAQFVKLHPECHPDEIAEMQYDAVRASHRIDVLIAYYKSLESAGQYVSLTLRLIDDFIREEADACCQKEDVAALRRLKKKYAEWESSVEYIDAQIKTITESLATRAWKDLPKDSPASKIKEFIAKYGGTEAGRMGEECLAQKYADFQFVKETGTIEAYAKYLDAHANEPNAYGDVQTLLEPYVFRRLKLRTDDGKMFNSLMARFLIKSPRSQVCYGGSGLPQSPFQVVTPPGSDYFIKLVNIDTKNEVGVFVQAGRTVEFEIPDGDYQVRYATGKNWYGPVLLFGLDASYSKAGSIFSFSNGSGISLKLKNVVHGNLSSSKMSATDF